MSTADVTLVLGHERLLGKTLIEQALARGERVWAIASARAPRLQGPAFAAVRFLDGDRCAIDFGLAAAEHQELCQSVRRVHHVLPQAESQADGAAVTASTRELLEFVRVAPVLQSAVHYSSVRVFGDRRGVCDEHTELRQHHIKTAGERALALADAMVHGQLARWPLVLARAGLLSAHSGTGELELESALHVVALLCLSAPGELLLPFPGRGEWPLNLVAVDWVAQRGHQLSECELARHQVVHLVEPQPRSARAVLELIAVASRRVSSGYGRDDGFAPAHFARALLRARSLENIVRSPRAFFETWMHDASYVGVRASEWLGPLPTPPLSSYVKAMVGFVASQARETRRGGRGARELDVEDPLL